MDTIEIVPIAQGHIEGFHRALDIVARQRRYLAFLEAPPIESTRAFVLDNIKRGHPQFVAVSAAGEVVGWCDVTPMSRPIQAHRGVFGVGLLPQFRGQGLGTKLTLCGRPRKATGHRFGMKLLFDQNLSFKLCQNLADVFPGSNHVRLLGLSESGDQALWEYAKSERVHHRISDVDFAELVALLPTPSKVIWLRVENQSTATISTLLRHHADLIAAFEKDDNATCLEVYERK